MTFSGEPAYAPALTDELAYTPAHELAAGMRRRDLSPVEVVDAFIARVEARNPWVEECRRLSALDFYRDQAVRTEIFDAFQGVLNTHDLLVTPTLACLPVDNADDGNTVGPSAINGEAVDPLIGWCLTYFVNFTGHPAASIPAGLTDGLVGMQLIGRRDADADVLTASAAFARLRPWRDSYQLCRERPLSRVQAPEPVGA